MLGIIVLALYYHSYYYGSGSGSSEPWWLGLAICLGILLSALLLISIFSTFCIACEDISSRSQITHTPLTDLIRRHPLYNFFIWLNTPKEKT